MTFNKTEKHIYIQRAYFEGLLNANPIYQTKVTLREEANTNRENVCLEITTAEMTNNRAPEDKKHAVRL
jgi:hypothetical protein